MLNSRVLLVIVSVALAVGLYFLPIKPLKMKESEKEAKADQVEESQQAFDAEAYFSEKKASLEGGVQDSFELLQSKIDQSSDNFALVDQMAAFCYRNKAPFLGARFEKRKIELTDSVEALQQIGDRLIRTSYLESADPGAKLFFSNAAINAYSKALEKSDKVEIKVRLASAYMDGTNQVMNGVTLLLEVLDDEPENLDANLILGRYGIISGQYEKALGRLNTVIEQDTGIAEAYLYRAEALNALGRSQEAIEDFEKCKELLDNPQLEKEIDVFIEELKNS